MAVSNNYSNFANELRKYGREQDCNLSDRGWANRILKEYLLELDFLKRCLSIAYTDSVREEKGVTYGVSVDFDIDYCKMVNDMTAADVQRMAQRILAAKRCIEVTHHKIS